MTDNPMKREVSLYYLGGLVSNGDQTVYVQSRGRGFRVPPVGGHIRLPLYYAHDLIQRGHNGVHSVWSLSPRDAEMAKAGKLPSASATSVHEMTIEELEALLAEKRQAESREEQPDTGSDDFVQELVAKAVVDDPEEPTEDAADEPAKPKRGRKPKNEEANE